MTDENQENQQQEQEQQQGKTFTEAEVQALIQKELAGIKANRDALLEEKKEQQRIAEQIAEEKRQAELEAARKNGDFQKIEEDLRRQLQEREEKLNQISQEREEEKVLRKATELASGLVVESFRPYLQQDIKNRAFRDENGVWRFKDRNGNVTSMTEEEFKQDLKSDARYADFTISSYASGGGATGGGFGGGANKEAKDYTIEERAELLQKNPALFKQLFSK